MINLAPYAIECVPNEAYYIPNYINEKQEEYLIKKTSSVIQSKWVTLSNRRLQNWGGIPCPNGMIRETIPGWLNNHVDPSVFDGFSPNHVLINEYKPGQGIMPHKDGPLYYPTVATISLGCHTILDFYNSQNQNNKQFSLLLERRSLLVLKQTMYNEFLHGIAENCADKIENDNIKNKLLLGCPDLVKKFAEENHFTLSRDSTRVSITIRYVPKSFKLKMF